MWRNGEYNLMEYYIKEIGVNDSKAEHLDPFCSRPITPYSDL
jgi:hypothetical protein